MSNISNIDEIITDLKHMKGMNYTPYNGMHIFKIQDTYDNIFIEYVDDSVTKYEFQKKSRLRSSRGIVLNNSFIWVIHTENMEVSYRYTSTNQNFANNISSIITEYIVSAIFDDLGKNKRGPNLLSDRTRWLFDLKNRIDNNFLAKKYITNTKNSDLESLVFEVLCKVTREKDQLSGRCERLQKDSDKLHAIQKIKPNIIDRSFIDNIKKHLSKIEHNYLYLSIGHYPDYIIIKVGRYISNPEKEAEKRSGIDLEGWEVLTPYAILDYVYYQIFKNGRIDIVNNTDNEHL